DDSGLGFLEGRRYTLKRKRGSQETHNYIANQTRQKEFHGIPSS
ncbi:unnamed protein product, partial [Allacma fusca]